MSTLETFVRRGDPDLDKPPCPDCNGEGFHDLRRPCSGWRCCRGTGVCTSPTPAPEADTVSLFARVNRAELEMLRHGLDLLHAHRRFNRRLGRPANGREVITLAHKLGITFGDRHREPQENPTTEGSDPRTEGALQA